MGIDIDIVTEIRRNGKWEFIPDIPESLKARSYDTFELLAEVYDVDGDHFPLKGLPKDVSEEGFRALDSKFNFSHNHITLREMLDFDYSDFIMGILYEVEELNEALRSFRGKLLKNTNTKGSIEENRFIQTVNIPGLGKATFIWEPDDKGEAWRTSRISKGIEELMAIGDRYNVAAEDIRIVFAFNH